MWPRNTCYIAPSPWTFMQSKMILLPCLERSGTTYQWRDVMPQNKGILGGYLCLFICPYNGIWKVSCELSIMWKETFLVCLIECKSPSVLPGVATDVIYYYFRIHILVLFTFNHNFYSTCGHAQLCLIFVTCATVLYRPIEFWSQKRYFWRSLVRAS
jgi:hypothetical protein